MQICYVDETGDTGDPSQKGASSCFALGAVIIDEKDWGASLDRWVAMRRGFRDQFGVPVRAELKANYLIRGSGPLAKLDIPPGHRRAMYMAHLRMLSDVNALAFGVVVDKERMPKPPGEDAWLRVAWETLAQRLERHTHHTKQRMLLVHDEGPTDEVRRIFRKARRHLVAGYQGGGIRKLQAKDLVEDPVPRNSKHSYGTQLADLVAYAGWRTYTPPGKNVARVVHQHMWDEIGPDATHSVVNVNSRRGRAPGVVIRDR